MQSRDKSSLWMDSLEYCKRLIGVCGEHRISISRRGLTGKPFCWTGEARAGLPECRLPDGRAL